STANGGEFIAFETATLTGTEAYTLSYLRRGGYGSSSQAHITGDVFVRIDDGVFRVPYDRGMIGQTVYFKFVSFNSFGGGEQTLSGATAYPHVIGASDVVAPPVLFDQLAGQFASPSSGSNFVPNPSFELNNIGATTGIGVVGTPVCDSWYVYQNDSGVFTVGRDTSVPDVGSNDLTIGLTAVHSLAASGSVACRVISAPIYVSAGQVLSFNGDWRTDSSGGNGSTVQWVQALGMLFYNAAGVLLPTSATALVASGPNAASAAYANMAVNQFTVPSGASYAQAYVLLQANNTSATVSTTLNSWLARFDNMNGLFVTSAGQVNYSSGATVDSLQPATASADNTSVATQVPILNPNFDFLPAGTGWAADAGTAWVTDMTGITPGGGTGCAKHVGSSSTPTGSYRNTAHAPCQAGQVVKYQALIKAIGANGYCTPTISFQNASNVEITSAAGTLVTGTATVPAVVTATAPAGTVYIVFQLTVNGHTAGTYLCDNLATNMQPSSLNEVPDSATRFAAVQANADNTASNTSALTASLSNQTQDNLKDGSTYLRTMQQSHAGGALTIDDATFQLPSVTGWAANTNCSIFGQSSSPTPSIGGQFLVVATLAAGAGYAYAQRIYSCNPGDSISVGGILAAVSGVSSNIRCDFYNAAGGFVSSIIAGTSASTWTGVSASGVVPPSAAKMYIGLRCEGAGS
ncbi:MAG: hypothetical protein WAM90_06620, partial [Rhodanobacter sp.]